MEVEGAAVVTSRFSLLSLQQLGAHGRASLLYSLSLSLSPYPDLMLSWGLLDEFREGPGSADIPPPIPVLLALAEV